MIGLEKGYYNLGMIKVLEKAGSYLNILKACEEAGEKVSIVIVRNNMTAPYVRGKLRDILPKLFQVKESDFCKQVLAETKLVIDGEISK